MILTAVALIIRDKRILLIKRSNYTKLCPHHWAFPGGKGEPGETIEQTLIREIKEELGVNMIHYKLFQTENVLVEGEPWSANRFIGDYEGKISIQEEEIDGFAWYTFEETKNLKIAFNHREVIEKAHGEGYL